MVGFEKQINLIIPPIKTTKDIGNSFAMRYTSNPLDLLAEVAVNGEDDEKPEADPACKSRMPYDNNHNLKRSFPMDAPRVIPIDLDRPLALRSENVVNSNNLEQASMNVGKSCQEKATDISHQATITVSQGKKADSVFSVPDITGTKLEKPNPVVSMRMIIGRLASSSMQMTPSNQVSTPPAKTRVKYKYPNIELHCIPSSYPLLDHDYCYENYCNIVLASTQMISETNLRNNNAIKKPIGDGKHSKRKISQSSGGEKTVKIHIKSKHKADLESIQTKGQRSSKKLKCNTRNNLGGSELREVNPSFEDQFLYFGAKKGCSRRQHIPDSHKSSLVFSDPDPEVEKISTSDETKTNRNITDNENSFSDSVMMSSANNDINDVLDVLGLSCCNPTGNNKMEEQEAAEGDEPAVEMHSGSEKGAGEDSDSKMEYINETDQITSSCLISDDSWNDLLLSMTDEQLYQVVHAFDEEDSGSEHTIAEQIELKGSLPVIHTAADDIKCSDFCSDCLTSDGPQAGYISSLSCLAKRACDIFNIPVKAEHSDSSQLSKTSWSLDLPEPDIISSEKNGSLELFEISNGSIPTQKTVALNDSLSAAASAANASPLSDSLKIVHQCDSVATPMVVPVTMYWNTFPALLIDGVKYVRLIDISRQALPSKETGLLKKRAQTLGYEVLNCSDIQRNLLVRYAFASPSRSNLIINETAAAHVIESYMEKSEIEELTKAMPSSPSSVSISVPATRKPAELISLMPQVLVEHQPLQQTRSINGLKASQSNEASVPERSSRLRQIKSSYRRFLKLGNTTMAHLSENVKECKMVEENSCDKGYYSDRSPDSCNISTKPVKLLPPVNLEDINTHTPPSPTPSELPSPLYQCKASTDELAFYSNSSKVCIRHTDFVPKRNGSRNYQDGLLHLERFKSLHSSCVQCCTCQQFFTVKAFTKHQHADKKLVAVKSRQRLEAREHSIDSVGWLTFKKQKQLYETSRKPLSKLCEPKLLNSSKTDVDDLNRQMSLKKRGRKQKRTDPDEVFYSISKHKKQRLH